MNQCINCIHFVSMNNKVGLCSVMVKLSSQLDKAEKIARLQAGFPRYVTNNHNCNKFKEADKP